MDDRRYFIQLLDDMLRRDWPRATRVADQTGHLGPYGQGSILDCPRFSLCLTGTGRYLAAGKETSEPVDVALRPGEALWTQPGCPHRFHPDSSYEALGIVFHSEFTRFLHARKRKGRQPGADPSGHRLIHSHHAPGTLDEVGHVFLKAFGRTPVGVEPGRYHRHLLHLVLSKARGVLELDTSPPGGKAHFSWQAACQYVREHCHYPELGRDNVARFLGLHPNHVSRLFRQLSGCSLVEYIRRCRLDRAQELLGDPRLNVSEVARLAGFASANYFIYTWRKRFGASPGRTRSRTVQ